MAEYFDYIVVGGGTAGLTAGGTGINRPSISIPAMMATNLHTDIDWDYSKVPQEGANQQKISYPRGKVLGGTSSINAMLSTWAEAEDYETIERLGNPGWGSKEIEKAFKKTERLINPPLNSPYIFNPGNHGIDGPVTNSFPKFIPPQYLPYFPACAAAGHVIQDKDSFAGNMEGAYIYPSAIDEKGFRVTSATAHYFPIKSRSNLIVRTDCEVDKLIVTSTDTTNSRITILGVEYYSSGTLGRAMVRHEVIMSAGVIGTPVILERSGMGKESILKPLDIPIALNLEGVGSNLLDHLRVTSSYRLKAGHKTVEDLFRDPDYAAQQKSIYEQSGGGLLSHWFSVADFQSLKSFVGEDGMPQGMKLLEDCPSCTSPSQFDAVVNRIKNGRAIEFSLVNAFIT
ncbi:hypothetical protein MJO29_002438 [Puccinia striiformis f. sp. tritici]|nr:hypothetical protein MJO29_002438 [Puccinia striiformis f. sp. tritici]